MNQGVIWQNHLRTVLACQKERTPINCDIDQTWVQPGLESTRLRHLSKEHGQGPERVEVNGESMVKCNECDKVFKKHAGWRNHYNVAHRDPTAPKLYSCTHCDYASNRCTLSLGSYQKPRIFQDQRPFKLEFPVKDFRLEWSFFCAPVK